MIFRQRAAFREKFPPRRIFCARQTESGNAKTENAARQKSPKRNEKSYPILTSRAFSDIMIAENIFREIKKDGRKSYRPRNRETAFFPQSFAGRFIPSHGHIRGAARRPRTGRSPAGRGGAFLPCRIFRRFRRPTARHRENRARTAAERFGKGNRPHPPAQGSAGAENEHDRFIRHSGIFIPPACRAVRGARSRFVCACGPLCVRCSGTLPAGLFRRGQTIPRSSRPEISAYLFRGGLFPRVARIHCNAVLPLHRRTAPRDERLFDHFGRCRTRLRADGGVRFPKKRRRIALRAPSFLSGTAVVPRRADRSRLLRRNFSRADRFCRPFAHSLLVFTLVFRGGPHRNRNL